MSTKQKVLDALMQAQPDPISGQAIASDLGLSRNAVWKAIEDLRQSGYAITQQGRKGYLLQEVSHQLDASQIVSLSQGKFDNLHIESHDSVTSTNDLAKAFAQSHPGQIGLFVAKEQTQGRGRHGRQFFSGLSDGLYLSFVLQPNIQNLQDLPLYTLMAATAMTQALEKAVDQPIQIKWINDLFFQGKKIAGILCESIMDVETQSISALVIGIGLNLAGSFADQDPAIQSVAGTIFGQTLPDSFNPNQLLADFLSHLASYHEDITGRAFIPYYGDRLLGLNQHVTYQKGNETLTGWIRGINQDGNLLVEDSQGQISTLYAGEIHFSSQQFANMKGK